MTLKPNSRITLIKTASGVRTLGRLVRDASGFGWTGVLEEEFNQPPIQYPFSTWNDAMAEFTRYMETSLGVKLYTPSNMFNCSILRQSTGFFVWMPGNGEHHNRHEVVRDHISYYEAGPLVNRLNAVRSYFGPRVDELLPDRLEDIEAKMPRREKKRA